MIMLWGLAQDRPLAAVHAALEECGQSVTLLDQRDVLALELDLCVGSTIRGVVRQGSQSFRLEDITAAYLRPYEISHLATVAAAGPGSREWAHAANVTEGLWGWAELTPALVVNRPAAMSANYSKPYQAAQIAACGFATPSTLITNDAKAARAFWRQRGRVIYKSISGQRSIVSRLAAAHAPRWQHLAGCPTQFQEYIPGTDYRVHVIGQEVFACEIVSEADDYRYASAQGKALVLRTCDLPAEIRARCQAMTQTMKLEVAGVDLRRTPQGAWYCFEVNPSPAFHFFQAATGQRMDQAIARLLAAV